MSKVTSPEGVVTDYAYDEATGNLTGIDGGGRSLSYSYNSRGQVTGITESGNTTRIGYSHQGNLASVTSPEGVVTTYETDVAGRRTATTVGSQTSSASYDLMGRETGTRSGNRWSWVSSLTEYDPVTGDMVSVSASASDPSGTAAMNGTSWSYDGLGRVVREAGPVTIDSMVYDLSGNVVRRYRVTAAGGTLMETMEHDRVGRVTRRVIEPRRHAAEIGFLAPFPFYPMTDGRGMDDSTSTAPGLLIPGDTITYAYDLSGNLLTATNRNGTVSRTVTGDGLLLSDAGGSFAYDSDRRVTRMGSTSYGYTSDGLLASARGPGGLEYTWSYDSLALPTAWRFPQGGETRTYDADRRLKERTVASGAITHRREQLSYDDRGKVVAERHSSDGMSYDAVGNLIGMTHRVGSPFRKLVREFRVVNGFGQLLNDSVVVGFGRDPGISVYDMGYDLAGRLVRKTERWASELHPDPPPGWFGVRFMRRYDSLGGGLEYEYEDRHVWGGHAHDVIEESRSYYGWDGLLHVQQVNRARRQIRTPGVFLTTTNGVYEVYSYDALGRRIGKRSIQRDGDLCRQGILDDGGLVLCYDMVESYSWLGDHLMSETREYADGTPDHEGDYTGTIEYVHGGGMDMPLGMVRNGGGVTLHASYRGLYAFATGSDGRTVDAYTAEWPGSNRRAGLGGGDHGEWRWYGQLVAAGTDATGLLYRRARYYDPENGQFTQPDPIGQFGGLNVYGFARWRPGQPD